MIFSISYCSLFLFLVWYCPKVRSQFPTHPLTIPALYTADTAVSNLPFEQLSLEQQEQHLQFLSDLDKAARTVAGVFPPFMSNNSQSPKYFTDDYYESHLSRSVVATIANMGYLPHLQNFACFAKRLNLHFIVLAVDDALFDMLSKSKHEYFQVVRYHGHFTADTDIATNATVASANNKSFDSVNKSSNHKTSTLSQAAGFQTQKFNLISLRKFEAVYDLQRLGYDVLFVDVDVMILQDVFPLFLRPGLRDISYMHSMNQICSASGEAAKYLIRSNRLTPNDGNTGFHFFQHPSFAQERLESFYQSEVWRDKESVNNHKLYPLGILRPAETQISRDFYRRLLHITETLPVLQMLHIFLKDVPHDKAFNPNENFDDQTMFWLFIRSLRSEQNRNIQSLLNKKSLRNLDKHRQLTKTQDSNDAKPVSNTNEEQFVEDNEEEEYYNREEESTNDVSSDNKKDGNNNPEEKEEEEEAADQKPHFHRFNSLKQHLAVDGNDNDAAEEEDHNVVVSKSTNSESEDNNREDETDNFDSLSSAGSTRSSDQSADTSETEAFGSELLSVETHDHKNNSKPQHFLLDTTTATSTTSSSSSVASSASKSSSSNTPSTEQTETNAMDVIKSILGGFVSRSSHRKSAQLPEKQPTELDTEDMDVDEDENIPHFHSLKTSKSSKHHHPKSSGTQSSEKVLDDDNVMNSLFLFSSASNAKRPNSTNVDLHNVSAYTSMNETYHLRGTSALVAAKAMREKNASYFDILLDLVVQDKVTINIGNKIKEIDNNNNDTSNDSNEIIQRQLTEIASTTTPAVFKRTHRVSKVSPQVGINSISNKRLEKEAQKEINSILSSLGIQNAKDIDQRVAMKGKVSGSSIARDVENEDLVQNAGHVKSKAITSKPKPASANHFSSDISANEELLRSFLLVSSTGTCQSTHLGHYGHSQTNRSIWSVHPTGKAAIEICALNNCQVAPAAFLYFVDLVKLSLKRMNKKFSSLVDDNKKKPSTTTPLEYVHHYPNDKLSNSAGFKLTQNDVDMLQLLLHQHDLPVVKSTPYNKYLDESSQSSSPSQSNSNHNSKFSSRKGSYWYALHGNYVTGETEKKQLMQDAGFWLVPPSSMDENGRFDFGTCLAFAHKPKA